MHTFFRKYIFQFVISLLSLTFLTVLFFAIGEKAVYNYAQIVRYSSTDLNEIVFSTSPDYEEVFYDFGGSAYAYAGDGQRLNCDIFMTHAAGKYEKNPLYLKAHLNEGECALSQNLAYRFGIAVGDRLQLRIGREEALFDFYVGVILPAQSGVDTKYMHEGVLILSENKQLTEYGRFVYTSFIKNGDEYKNLVDDSMRGSPILFTDVIIRQSVASLFVYTLVSVFALCIFIAVSEMLIFSKIGKKYRDYAILHSYGMGKSRLWRMLYLDMAIKYILPLAVVLCIGVIKLQYYHILHLIPLFVFFAVGVLIVTILTFIIIKRRNGGWIIRR